jgi:hypothetical protein
MNPDVNKIFNKFKEDKVELSTEKIELGSLKELTTATKKVDKDLAAGQKAERRFVKLSQQAVQLAKEFRQYASEYGRGIGMSAPLVQIMNEFVRNGRELGVDVTKTNEYKNAEMTYSALEEYREEIMKLAAEAELKAKQLS